jgi:arsenate reductase (glutaredoxin)
MPKSPVSVLHYPQCSTCKKALKWLDAHRVAYELRHIVDEPPKKKELTTWVRASGKPVRKWLNTSGQSYRALGKAAVDAMSDAEVVDALANDGKLVKRPVVVVGDRVLVGFDEAQYAEAFSR